MGIIRAWPVLFAILATTLGFSHISIRNAYSLSIQRSLSTPTRTLQMVNMDPSNQNIPVNPTPSVVESRSQKMRKRWATGLSLGAIGTLWIFSGNGFFTLGFLFASLVAQNEYYAMVRAAGQKYGLAPATKIGIVSSLTCYITASFFPAYHELVMPLSASFLMIWLLIFNKKSASISEISTSLLGMFYIGYLPSFWVRLRALENIIEASSMFPQIFGRFKWLNVDSWTAGSMVTWWTWTSIVFADVGAYFIGKNFGKNKLSRVSSAAGSASPNKTIEGALGGFLCGSIFSLIGAYLLRWPYWPITGALYGLLISFIALVGDLTASMMKRDAGIKDTGNILPGHGGLLDRIDSYMLNGPLAYFFCIKVLPFAQLLQKQSMLSLVKAVVKS